MSRAVPQEGKPPADLAGKGHQGSCRLAQGKGQRGGDMGSHWKGEQRVADPESWLGSVPHQGLHAQLPGLGWRGGAIARPASVLHPAVPCPLSPAWPSAVRSLLRATLRVLGAVRYKVA